MTLKAELIHDQPRVPDLRLAASVAPAHDWASLRMTESWSMRRRGHDAANAYLAYEPVYL